MLILKQMYHGHNWVQIQAPGSLSVCVQTVAYFPLCLALSPPVIVVCGTPDTISSLKGDREVAEDTVIILVDLFRYNIWKNSSPFRKKMLQGLPKGASPFPLLCPASYRVQYDDNILAYVSLLFYHASFLFN